MLISIYVCGTINESIMLQSSVSKDDDSARDDDTDCESDSGAAAAVAQKMPPQQQPSPDVGQQQNNNNTAATGPRPLDKNNSHYYDLRDDFLSGKLNMLTKPVMIKRSDLKYSQYHHDVFRKAVKRIKLSLGNQVAGLGNINNQNNNTMMYAVAQMAHNRPPELTGPTTTNNNMQGTPVAGPRRLDHNNSDYYDLKHEFLIGKWNMQTKPAVIKNSHPKYSQYHNDVFRKAIKRIKQSLMETNLQSKYIFVLLCHLILLCLCTTISHKKLTTGSINSILLHTQTLLLSNNVECKILFVAEGLLEVLAPI